MDNHLGSSTLKQYSEKSNDELTVASSKVKYMLKTPDKESDDINKQKEESKGCPDTFFDPHQIKSTFVQNMKSADVRKIVPNQEDAEIGKEIQNKIDPDFNQRCRSIIDRIWGRAEVKHFIVKTLAILTLKSLFDVLICGIIYGVPHLKNWFEEYWWIFFIFMSISILMIAGILLFCRKLNKFPLNYLTLIVFTIVNGFLYGSFSGFLSGEGVFLTSTLSPLLFATLTILCLIFNIWKHWFLIFLISCFSISLLSMFYFIFILDNWYYINI